MLAKLRLKWIDFVTAFITAWLFALHVGAFIFLFFGSLFASSNQTIGERLSLVLAGSIALPIWLRPSDVWGGRFMWPAIVGFVTVFAVTLFGLSLWRKQGLKQISPDEIHENRNRGQRRPSA
jgi:hypothetical protein